MKTMIIGSLLCASLLVAACSSGGSCQIESVLPEADGSAAPRDRIALDRWMLILPVDAQGGRAGSAETVFPEELTSGYSSDWFFASTDGGVAFWSPVDGARTPDSQFARSELRHLRDPSDPTVNWSSGDTVQMTASLSVSQVPDADGRVVVGKLVGFRNDDNEYPTLARMILRLHANTCRASLFALVAEAPHPNAPSAQITLIDDAIRLNERFGYAIEMNAGNLTLSSGSKTQTVAIDARWADTPVYFMAGAALSTRGTDALDGGSATFHVLNVTP